jgi:hypothetical protein
VTGKADSYLHLFLFENCTQTSNKLGGEITEETEVFKLPIQDAWGFLKTQEIVCAHTYTILTKALLFLDIKSK